MGIDELIKDTKEVYRKFFDKNASKKPLKFSYIDKFPNEKGVYFIYAEDDLIYIGSASADDRTIKIRCRQYIHCKDTGSRPFRKKVKKKYSIELQQVPEYIMNNFSAKFIEMPNYTQGDILLIERIMIATYIPELNDW